MREFFAMGGYASFVWSAYAITAVVLVVNIVSARIAERRTIRGLKARARRASRREQS